MDMTRTIILALSCTALVACSATTIDGPSGGDANGAPSANGDDTANESGSGGGSGELCSAPSLDGAPSVNEQIVTSNDFPRAAGGIISDGRYVLTKKTHYYPESTTTTPGPAETLTEVLVISNGTLRLGGEANGDGEFFYAWTYEASGTSLDRTESCTTSHLGALIGYSATSTQIKLYGDPAATGGTVASEGQAVYIFERQ